MAKRQIKRKRKSQSSPLIEIYENIEAVFARKGSKSLWPKQPFKHKFEKGAAVYGVRKGGAVKLKGGDIVIRSKRGKRLWKMFEYDRRTGDRRP